MWTTLLAIGVSSPAVAAQIQENVSCSIPNISDNSQVSDASPGCVDIYTIVAREIRESEPDYDNLMSQDLQRLDLRTADFISGRIGFKLPYDDLMPSSFFTRYGDQARPVFARAIMAANEGNRNLGSSANGMLRGILRQAYNLTREQTQALNLDSPITTTSADGTNLSVKPAEAVTYIMAQAIASSQTTTAEIDIPSAIMRQVVASNSSIISRPWGGIAPRVVISDEESYLVGYAVGRGYSTRLGVAVSTTLPPSDQVCRGLPRLEASIFNPVPDQLARTAYSSGYARAVSSCADDIEQSNVPDLRPQQQRARGQR
jgi:hypothetical protein